MTRAYLKFLLPGVALVALLGAAFAWMRPSVRVAAVTRGAIVDVLPATVSVRAEYVVELRSDIGGRVRTSNLALGRAVEAHEVVMSIDDSDLQLQLESLELSLATARRRAEIGSATELQLLGAREVLGYGERMHAAGNLATSELEARRRDVRRLEQQLELEKIARESEIASIEVAIKAKMREIEKARISAPVAGQIIDELAREGDLIGPGAVVGRLLSQSRIVEAKIAEEYFARVSIGQSATVRILGYGDEQFTARVTEVLPALDTDSRRYTLHLDVQIPAGRLVPGLSGEALIVAARREGALLIPRRAVVGEQVLVVVGNRVEQRSVQRGFSSTGEVEIVAGLQEGEWVIVDSPQAFRAGDRVRVAGP